jgi:hypothetical protein
MGACPSPPDRYPFFRGVNWWRGRESKSGLVLAQCDPGWPYLALYVRKNVLVQRASWPYIALRGPRPPSAKHDVSTTRVRARRQHAMSAMLSRAPFGRGAKRGIVGQIVILQRRKLVEAAGIEPGRPLCVGRVSRRHRAEVRNFPRKPAAEMRHLACRAAIPQGVWTNGTIAVPARRSSASARMR